MKVKKNAKFQKILKIAKKSCVNDTGKKDLSMGVKFSSSFKNGYVLLLYALCVMHRVARLIEPFQVQGLLDRRILGCCLAYASVALFWLNSFKGSILELII